MPISFQVLKSCEQYKATPRLLVTWTFLGETLLGLRAGLSTATRFVWCGSRLGGKWIVYGIRWPLPSPTAGPAVGTAAEMRSRSTKA